MIYLTAKLTVWTMIIKLAEKCRLQICDFIDDVTTLVLRRGVTRVAMRSCAMPDGCDEYRPLQ